MDIKNFVTRITYMPFGIISGLLELANSKARDFENKRRFPSATIDNNCCFTKDSTVGIQSNILHGSIINHSHIGSYTYISRGALIQNTVIGSYCSIAHDVTLGLGTHPLHTFSTSPLFYKINNPLNLKIVDKDVEFEEYRPIKIGNDVWIGAKVIVLDGVEIGHGAVLAAGAVVTKDVAPYAVVGGVPAKLIKYRFSTDVQNSLLESCWWEKAPQEVFSHIGKYVLMCHQK